LFKEEGLKMFKKKAEEKTGEDRGPPGIWRRRRLAALRIRRRVHRRRRLALP